VSEEEIDGKVDVLRSKGGATTAALLGMYAKGVLGCWWLRQTSLFAEQQ
jgi:hypothetical protein